MPKISVRRPAIACASVSANQTAQLQDFLHKGCKVGTLGVSQVNKRNTSNLFCALIFDTDPDQWLFFRTSTAFARLLATDTDIIFTNFYDYTQLVPALPRNCSPELLPLLPPFDAATEVQDLLQPQGLCSIVPTSNMPYGSKPKNQRIVNIMVNRVGSHRRLHWALSTMARSWLRLPTGPTFTASRHKSATLVHFSQLINAPAPASESVLDYQECLWVVFVEERNSNCAFKCLNQEQLQ